MLRRIPAVKWAFTRLRPVPHGSSIDATPAVADVSPVIVQDIIQDIAPQEVVEAASTQVAEISTASRLDEAESEAAAPSAEHDAAISVIAESPPAAPTEAGAGDDSARHTPSDIEPVVEEKASAAEIDTATDDAPEPAISNDLLPIAAEAVAAVETSPSPVEVERDPLDAPALVVHDDRSSDAIVDVERSGDAPCVTSADAEVLVEPVSEIDFDSGPSPDDAAAIAPVIAESAAPVAAVSAEHDPADTASVITEIAPAPAPVSPAPEVRSAPQVRARAAEPLDRTALIRQRWAESGIRMWNPRLHGTGEATLNIQGSVGLLPPAPGETMPRYDKLEFRMLGGQIVCEGVIVEGPAQASQRSFTRLAEPAKLERVREPARERQAALA
ncbi:MULTISPECIES: hypothetical protein [unclassified Bradyrhizobium]|uniref:hypothetical protein n=1 Tax=unclassified Bradyrhizobium TaxID=2631580 RepID=UPI00211DD922|nr:MULTISPECIES: hypothetical protein [unclassified Bradyrhizobium]MDD1534846.1 hypothetical protein [Bradyrhizobium sp. WBOS8]MDD1584338.1 hypothetical protein [Bradyrhizobium sp. WBOS4]UUO50414.1 hypothetical protein DCM78_28020 [Bradyrhizobium sp. WBOS04]UUO57791.1 hypothetical protein DCM80_00520 [Bradyrhizobium sp. WBOS08]